MRQLIKSFLCVGGLIFGLQSAWAFSMLGPVGNGGDAWQGTSSGASANSAMIGYNPLFIGPAPPFLIDSLLAGPKNIGEGYRRNTPVMYYTFDSTFGDYFGSSGELAVEQAFDILNSLTNVDTYSADLSEFPLNSRSINHQAWILNLRDLKSVTLSIMMEQLGLADAVRYTWALHDRYAPPNPICVFGDPSTANNYQYLVIMRNLDIYLTPLGYNPYDWGQYSPYVNGELYDYNIFENCGMTTPLVSPPDADAIEIAVDPLHDNPPVASGEGEDGFADGEFYTGLTRDDVAGLRWLYSSSNYFAPSASYLESSAAGSVAVSGGGAGNGPTYQLTTFSFAMLPFMNPVALQTAVPGIVITSTNIVIVNGQTNYSYTFANVVTYSSSTNTIVITQVQTTTSEPRTGWPITYPNPGQITTTTTATTNTSSTVPGDFYVVPTNSCGLTILISPPPSNIVVAVTNNLGTVTNASGNTTNIISTNIVTVSTNHVLWVTLCTNAPGTTNSTSVVGNFQGIGRIRFVRVSDDNYNYQTRQFYNPITNQYSMVLMRNGQASTVTFRRVVTTPDFVFAARDMAAGLGAIPIVPDRDRNVNFNQANVSTNLAGPGTIDPSSTITFDKVGPVYVNTAPSFMNGPAAAYSRYFIWGSFDGTTNAPVVYPNGTSIANLTAQNLIRISPATLPDGINGVAYNGTNVTLSATGGQSPYTWSLAPGSAGLPTGLALSTSGVLSGTPTETGTFDDIVIRMTDSTTSSPLSPFSALSVDTLYSLTIH